MLKIDGVPLSAALAEHMPAQGVLAEPAVRALHAARELEREVLRLHRLLAATPAGPGRDPAWKDELLALLGKVVVFRLALPDPTEGGAAPLPSARTD